MRIFIVTMDDPLYTIPFFKEIIDSKSEDIVGLAVAKGDRMKIGKKRSKLLYLLSLLLIMGITFFITNVIKTLSFKVKKKLSKHLSFVKSPSIIEYAKSKKIKTYDISSPNEKEFIKTLREAEPDVIINQSQHILRKDFLSIPKIGVLNRHNALLPKNRGRLTPFWVLYNKENETGVSIHFVNEGIDTGDIIVQEKFSISRNDTFKTIVNKNYRIASKAMIRALDLIAAGNFKVIPNNDSEATYNSVPEFKDALRYRLRRIIKN